MNNATDIITALFPELDEYQADTLKVLIVDGPQDLALRDEQLEQLCEMQLAFEGDYEYEVNPFVTEMVARVALVGMKNIEVTSRMKYWRGCVERDRGFSGTVTVG